MKKTLALIIFFLILATAGPLMGQIGGGPFGPPPGSAGLGTDALIDTATITWGTTSTEIRGTVVSGGHSHTGPNITGLQLSNGVLPDTINATTDVQIGGTGVLKENEQAADSLKLYGETAATYANSQATIESLLAGHYTVQTATPFVTKLGKDAGSVTDAGTLYGTFIGFEAGLSAVAEGSLAIGYQALKLAPASVASYNLAIGHTSMVSVVSAVENIGLGHGTLNALTTGDNNIAIGNNAQFHETSGSSNVAIGDEAMHNVKSGIGNVAVGHNAYNGGSTTDYGDYNVFIGSNAGELATTANLNTVCGYSSADKLTTGTFNAFFGAYAGNVAEGASSYNTMLGAGTGNAATTGSYNTLLGARAGVSLTTGGYNIMIGKSAGAKETNTTAGIGYLYIDSCIGTTTGDRADLAADRANAIIFGKMAATAADQTIQFNAKGTFSNDLDVVGRVRCGDTTGTTEIKDTGIFLYGDARQWNDFNMPAENLKTAGSPSWEAVNSTVIYGLMFDETSSTQEVFCSTEMLHNWAEGTDIDVHLHWAPTNTTVGSVEIYLDWCWTNPDGTLAAPVSNVKYMDTGGTAFKHTLTDILTIPGTGYKIGSMLQLRVSRKANNAGDTYDADIWLQSVGVHALMNTIGSTAETTK